MGTIISEKDTIMRELCCMFVERIEDVKRGREWVMIIQRSLELRAAIFTFDFGKAL